MHRSERFIIIAAMINMGLYIPCFLGLMVFEMDHTPPPNEFPFAVWHLTGMCLNLLAIIATIRDLYRRSFVDPSAKLTWCLLIVCTGGIGWSIYVYRYLWRPCSATADNVPDDLPRREY